MSTRIKLPSTIISRTRAEELLGEIATLKLEERDQKTAMDRGITSIKEQYEVSLVALGKQIEEKTAILESWAAANPGEFPKGRKSIELLHGIIGYRTGTPKLKLLAKRTWDIVLEALKSTQLRSFVRTKEEVNKEGLLSSYAQGTINDDDLREIGCKVVQDETFFVEPALSDLEARTGKAVAA